MSKLGFLTNQELQGLSEALEEALSASYATEADYGFMISPEGKDKMLTQRTLWHRLQVEVNDKLEERS